jgi:hypothetical protein
MPKSVRGKAKQLIHEMYLALLLKGLLLLPPSPHHQLLNLLHPKSFQGEVAFTIPVTVPLGVNSRPAAQNLT